MLDGGKAVLFTLTTEQGAERWDKAQIVVQALQSGKRTVVFRGGSAARYVPTGHLVYALRGTLLAIPFDLKTLEVRGGPVPMVEGVRQAPVPARYASGAQFALSAGGSLVYIPGELSGTSAQPTLALADRDGHIQPLGLPPQAYSHPRISPDGNRLVVGTDDGKEANLGVDLRPEGWRPRPPPHVRRTEHVAHLDA